MTPKKRQNTSATFRKSMRKSSKMSSSLFARRRKNTQLIGKSVDNYSIDKGTYVSTAMKPTKVNTVSKKVTDTEQGSTEPSFAWLD